MLGHDSKQGMNESPIGGEKNENNGSGWGKGTSDDHGNSKYQRGKPNSNLNYDDKHYRREKWEETPVVCPTLKTLTMSACYWVKDTQQIA